MTDFKHLSIDIIDKKYRYTSLHREHGHGANLTNSFESTIADDPSRAVDQAYCRATARLFLAVRSALDSDEPVLLQ